MRSINLIFISILVYVNVSYAESGMISVKSSNDVKTTADILENILTEKGMTIFTRINHTEGAKKVGLELRPTELIIFGNPKVGTKLMHCGQSVAIDLPLKALIWEDAVGQVWLTYNDPEYLVNRHSIIDCEEVVTKIKNALNNFAKAATMQE